MTHASLWFFVSFLLLLGGCDDGSTPSDADMGTDAQADADADADADGDGDTDADGDADSDEMADGDVPTDPVVTTTAGDVQGSRGEGYLEFLGIPYAAPPVGPLRFRPPEPPESWTEPRLATTEAAACPQEVFGMSMGDEDCLVVNVHTPDPMPADAPVMVWIHGGGFTLGDGTQTDNGTRGDRLAAGYGVVVVSMNYRLGALGFLAHPELTAESGASGNWGFLDQVAALRWVRDNIVAFGGDPDNVTIFGESAGGVSVCLHLISPLSAGLFQRAITESGLCDTEPDTLEEAEALGEDFATRLGCDGVATDAASCLRDQTAEALVEATLAEGTSFGALSLTRSLWPNVDGDAIPGSFRAQVTAGTFNAVPTIVGWNADEGTLFVMLAEQGGLVVDETVYHDMMQGLADAYGVSVDDLEAQYPLDGAPDPGAALADALGDASLACPSRRAAQLLASRVETRVYHFEYPDAPFQLPGDRALGAFHSAEVQYVFGHPSEIGTSSFSGDDLALHEAMAGYWTSYAFDGVPEVDGSASWPIYDEAGDEHLVLDRDIRAGVGADRDVCEFWEGP